MKNSHALQKPRRAVTSGTACRDTVLKLPPRYVKRKFDLQNAFILRTRPMYVRLWGACSQAQQKGNTRPRHRARVRGCTFRNRFQCRWKKGLFFFQTNEKKVVEYSISGTTEKNNKHSSPAPNQQNRRKKKPKRKKKYTVHVKR